MPIEVMAVVGEANMRKTSTIRALTGVGRNPLWDVAYSSGVVYPTYVHQSALQESEVTAAQFISDVRAAKVDYVIVALRARQRTAYGKPYPDADAYLTAFKAAGWRIRGNVELVAAGKLATPSLAKHAPALLIPGASTIPPNQIAAQLRAAWNIL